MNWTELKSHLHEVSELHPIFLSSCDEIIDRHIAGLQGAQPAAPTYEPLLFDDHLKDLAALADRVLAYRREARDLEIAAVKALTDELLFDRQSILERDQQIEQLRRQRKKLEMDTNSAAAQSFGTGSGLESGFQTLSNGHVVELQEEIAAVDREIQTINDRYQALKAYHDDYKSRYREDGNAHNYGQRAKRATDLMNEDLSEAFEKAVATTIGWEMVYGKPLAPIPLAGTLSFIDDFVIWCRKVIRDLEIARECEVNYDVVLPLVQVAWPNSKPILDPATMKTALKATADGLTRFKVSFEVDGSAFHGRNVRLRSVGLSFGNNVYIKSSGIDSNATAESYARLSATIQPPAQQPSGLAAYKRPPVILGNVSALTGSEPSSISKGAECQNLSPVGEWIILISPTIVYKDDKTRTLDAGVETPMNDLKLHLGVRCTPDTL